MLTRLQMIQQMAVYEQGCKLMVSYFYPSFVNESNLFNRTQVRAHTIPDYKYLM